MNNLSYEIPIRPIQIHKQTNDLTWHDSRNENRKNNA